MRKTALLLASMTVAVLFFSAIPGSAPQAALAASTKPNFVFILADDMREDDLKYMPKTRLLLGEQGMRFANAYVSLALCCPSRATIMRGQYAHNTEVWTSNSRTGAWQTYRERGYQRDNLATRLDEAGYRTGLFGKYLNKYGGTSVPQGWDDWFAWVVPYDHPYFDYDVNDNGTIKHFGNSKGAYSTDVLSEQSRRFISASVNKGKPFFAYVAPSAPHGPSTPAPRDSHAFDGKDAPRPPSFNEKDVSDKPPWIRSLPRLSQEQIAEMDVKYEDRLESLQALDDLVEAVVDKLRGVGALNNTYVAFTSDNGYHFGEHRLPRSSWSNKWQPYEESVHMPLLVRGPGVRAGSVTHRLVLNTDYFPTFTDLGGATTPDYVDGRSLRPLLEGSATTWRTGILLERLDPQRPGRSFSGIVSGEGKKYVEYRQGFKELYNVEADPYELRNSYDADSPPGGLERRLQKLKDCAATTCRQAERGA